MHDIRLALRQLRKSPGFAITIVLTIALGIGANTAIFTLVHAILMKSLPVADPSTLYRVGDKDDCCVNGGFMNDDGDFDLFSYELYQRLVAAAPEFDQLAAMQSGGNIMTVRRGSEPAKSLRSEYVSGNYFSTFGIGPFAGRTLTSADDTQGASPAVVVSYEAWQSQYGSDPSLVGSTLYLQGQPATVVGVAPPGFFGDRVTDNPPRFSTGRGRFYDLRVANGGYTQNTVHSSQEVMTVAALSGLLRAGCVNCAASPLPADLNDFPFFDQNRHCALAVR
jgi:MacB-like periplasmic core domain